MSKLHVAAPKYFGNDWLGGSALVKVTPTTELWGGGGAGKGGRGGGERIDGRSRRLAPNLRATFITIASE
jgi:hypothetical protein